MAPAAAAHRSIPEFPVQTHFAVADRFRDATPALPRAAPWHRLPAWPPGLVSWHRDVASLGHVAASARALAVANSESALSLQAARLSPGCTLHRNNAAACAASADASAELRTDAASPGVPLAPGPDACFRACSRSYVASIRASASSFAASDAPLRTSNVDGAGPEFPQPPPAMASTRTAAAPSPMR